ncbi:hypothetical protein [Cognatilysobacter segetis]|uniref:hypothetical protein n=1 Tax=Cognatilysobacter segetis TaxID=2492394 RepID=UPI00105B5DF7|nr:hypothetical protein [Lysobacter segetis]
MSARPMGTWLLAAAGVAVLASLAAAIAVIGTPAEQRRLRLDEARVAALGQLEAAIDRYRLDEGRLPARLDAVPRVRNASPSIARDPETGAPFGYRVVDARHYVLCAAFARPTPTRSGRWVDPDWRHPAGRHCFARTAGGRAADAAAAAAEAAKAAAQVVD